MNKNKISRKLLAVLMALCVIFAYTGFAFAGTEGEDTTTPETGTEVTETVVEDEPVEGTEELVVEETTEDTEEEPAVEETPAPKAKKASKKAKSSLSLLADGDDTTNTPKRDVIEFVPATGSIEEHNVTIKVNDEEQGYRTIYCLQHDYVWPMTKDDGFNVKYARVDAENPLLTAERMAIIQKILYGGAPYNAAGIFNDYIIECREAEMSEAEILDGMVFFTQHAIWEQLAIWGVTGDGEALGREFAMPFSYDLIDYATSADIEKITISIKEKDTVASEGKLSKTDDGKWKSEALKVVNSVDSPLIYTITTPDEITAVNAEGDSITSIEGNKVFYLVSNSEDITNAKVTVTTKVEYPTEVEQYRPLEKAVVPGDDLNNPDDTKEEDYQIMLCVGTTSEDLIATFTVNPNPEEKDPEEKDPTNPDNPGGNTTPPAINPTPTPSLPTVTPDGDGTDTPATPDNPSDDEMDSDALGNGGADTIDDEDDSIDGDPMGDPDAIDDEEDVDADALGVKTGDASDMIPWTVGFTAALLGLFVALKVRRREN